jgi:hypothetical protein
VGDTCEAMGHRVQSSHKNVRDDRLLSMPAAGLSDLEQFIITLGDIKEGGHQPQDQPFLIHLVRSNIQSALSMELAFFVESGILHWVIFLSRRPFTKLLFQVSKCQFLHKFFLNCVSQSSPVSTLTMFFFFFFGLKSWPIPWATPPGFLFVCVMGFFEIEYQELFSWAGFETWSFWSLPP